MEKYQIQFLSLLRSGLWDKPISLELFTDEVDWAKILNLAQGQTVLGIIFDAINLLPSEYQPSSNIMRKLFKISLEIEKHNLLINQNLLDITHFLNDNGISTVLLKGSGVAQNYPFPNHRQGGDIDIYVGPSQYEKAVQLVIDKGVMEGAPKSNFKHFHFSLNSIIIEIHKIAEHLENPKTNKFFQDWTLKHLEGKFLRKWTLDNTEISLPPCNFDAIYIFAHIFGHFLAVGIGLRQICDWMLYLHTHKNLIDRSQLETDLKSFGLLHPWQCFGCILVKYLGLPKNEFPLYNKKFENKASIILTNYILESGNFGQYDKKAKNIYAENISQKAVKLTQRTKRVIKLLSLFPSHVTFYYLNFLKRGFTQNSDD